MELNFGKSTIIYGEKKEVSMLVLELCVSLLEKSKSNVAFIDSDNIFNPYYVARLCRHHSKDTMKRIMISRPFTAYQLKSIVSKLDQFVAQNGIRCVIISSINELFYEIEDKDEADFLLKKIIADIGRITKKNNLMMIIGNSDFDYLEKLHDKVDEVYSV